MGSLQPSNFTETQIRVLEILERTGACLSLVSVLSIFLAYGLFPRLRTVPNTFIVFASLANTGACVASIIAYDGIRAGDRSSLCQAQAFMLEFFIQSDPWWALAMAINVMLIFFTKTNPHTIKKWGWLYCLICYGGPFIISLICLKLRSPGKSLVYGNASLWCWITTDWNPLRIYTYYMLVWICILASIIIYVGIGVYVFRARGRLRQLSGTGSNVRVMASYPTTTQTDQDKYPSISVPSTSGPPNADPLASLPRAGRAGSAPAGPSTGPSSGGTNRVEDVVSLPIPTFNPAPSPRTASTSAAAPTPPPPPPIPVSPLAPVAPVAPVAPMALTVPALDTLDLSPTHESEKRSRLGSLGSRATAVIDRFTVVDPVKRAYLRTSILFCISVLVTWIPSSINRIHSLVTNDSPFGYNVATACVLPLQGVWNGLIFFITSWKVFKECVKDLRTPRKCAMKLSMWRSRAAPPPNDRRTRDTAAEEASIGSPRGPWANRRGSWNFIFEDLENEENEEDAETPPPRRSSTRTV